VLPASIGRRDLIRDSPDTDFRRGMIRHSRALRKAPRARRRPGGRAERRSDARTLRPGGFQPFSGDHRTQLSRRVVDPDPHGTGLCDRDLGEPEGIFKFSVSEQAAVRGDPGAVEFELDPAVEIDPRRLRCCFTHRMRHDRIPSLVPTY
jgi:hypothetical protein